MTKLVLNPINSRYGSIDALNANFDAIEAAFENTLSRDGTTPNSLEADIDANSHRILNLPDPVNGSEPATKAWVEGLDSSAATSASQAAASAAAAALSESAAEAAAENVVDWEWKNTWTTGVAYKKNNTVYVSSGTYEGWTFICLVDHTAGGTFSTDYSAGKWAIMAKRGAAGTGTGDMIAANNLSDLTNFATARTNLGVPSNSGTGATGTWGINISGSAVNATGTGTAVDTTTAQTLTNKTLSGVTLNDGYTEEIFTITDGTTVDLNPANGSIQLWTLGANRTPTASSFAAGRSILLMVDDGTARTITWTTIGVVWKTDAGVAPTLNTTGYTAIALWKVGTTVYGARVGNA